MKNGQPIESVRTKNAVDPGIRYSLHMEGWRAAHHTGLDLWQWEQGLYPKWFRAKTIAFYRYDRQIEAHVREASQPKKK